MNPPADKLLSRAEQLPEGSTRRRLLEGVRRFKAAWVDFGRLLSEARRKELWRPWGYESFDKYCAKELFIRRATADKLTRSFGFLERHEPGLARAKGEVEAPPFEVIEVLSRAEESGRLPADGWRELRDEVLDRPPTPAAMNRKLTEKYGPDPLPEGEGQGRPDGSFGRGSKAPRGGLRRGVRSAKFPGAPRRSPGRRARVAPRGVGGYLGFQRDEGGKME